jgi:hypothetical protein
MMQLKDLRHGNFVQKHSGEIVAWDCSLPAVNDENAPFEMWYLSGDRIAGLDPIYLTKEWLNRFGFVRHGGEYKTWMLNGFMIDDDFCPCIEDAHEGYLIIIGVKASTVHQLQNTYRSLTGEELQIKKE